MNLNNSIWLSLGGSREKQIGDLLFKQKKQFF